VIDVSVLRLLLLAITGWLDRREREALAYVIEENRLLRRQVGQRRLRFTGDDRRRLVPSEQRVRYDDRCEVTQRCSSQPVRPYREAPPVVIGEPQAPVTDLPPEEAILLDQIGERFPLPAIEPTGNGQKE
jgi:hypothetical protein